jgi:hypothetical protein
MSYIRKVIGDDESLLVLTRPHWIYLIEGLFWFLVFTAAGIVADFYFHLHFGITVVTFDVNLGPLHFDDKRNSFTLIMMSMGLAILWLLFLVYVGTEVGLTNRRIIYKRGFFFIRTEQTELADISAESVTHGWLGWLLKYGRIRLDCRFVDDMWLPAIKEPYTFLKSSHRARLEHPEIEYHKDDFIKNMDRIEKEHKEHQARNLREIIKINFRKAVNR